MLNDQVGSVPVAVFHAVATDTTTVFYRLGNRTLTFGVPKSVATDVVVDSETGSQWDRYGECIAGKSKASTSRRTSQSLRSGSLGRDFTQNTEIYAASTGSR